MLIIIIVPAVLIIRIILTSKELSTRYYYFAVNFLVADILGAITRFSSTMLYIIFYSLHVNVMNNIVLYWITLFLFWSTTFTHLATNMSFVPLAVERFITIAFPYRHRSILTNRRAILMGMAVWIVSVILATVALTVVQIEISAPFGDFYPVKNSGILVLIGFLPRVFSITLVTSTNINLHGQIA